MTPEQQKLIDRWLIFYEQLDLGQRLPNTADQVHFVSVCRGKDEPHTKHEDAYIAYRAERPFKPNAKTRTDKRKQFWRNEGKKHLAIIEDRHAKRLAEKTEKREVSLKEQQQADERQIETASLRKSLREMYSGQHAGSQTRGIVDPRAPKSYARFIDEPWGTREAWKRDSAMNRSSASKPKN